MKERIVVLGIAALASACTSSTGSESLDATEAERAAWVRQQVSEHNAWLPDEVRAEKYAAMAGSPFAFFRGTNHLYWSDFAGDERLDTFDATTFLQGDLHVGNYGSFHDDEGRLVYGLNDFDEGVVGDYQLDLWRGAVSLVMVADDLGLGSGNRREVVEAFTEAYLDACDEFVGNDHEQAAVITLAAAEGPLAELLAEVATKTRAGMLAKWTEVIDGQRLLRADHEDLAPIDDPEALLEAFAGYGETLSGGLVWDASYFAVKDAARRIHAGIGSLGVPRYYLLIDGPTSGLEDDVLLDVKYVAPATALSYVQDGATFATEAERSVAAQKALLVDTDDHLGWFALDGGSYAVRERSPYKDDIDLDEIDGTGALKSLAAQWGAILAAAHARADEDYDEQLVSKSFEKRLDEVTDGRRGKFHARVWDVSSSYAAQVEKDWQAFLPLAQP